MKKFLGIFLLVALICPIFTEAQVTKNSWLLGGNASFNSEKEYGQNNNFSKEWAISLIPDVGYFIADRWALGIKSTLTHSYSFTEMLLDDSEVRTNSISIGPFTRLYFLPPEKKVNIYVEIFAGYDLSKSTNNFTGKINHKGYRASGSAGIVYFLRPSVGLETGISYQHFKTDFEDGRSNYLSLNLGFQIYLPAKKR